MKFKKLTIIEIVLAVLLLLFFVLSIFHKKQDTQVIDNYVFPVNKIEKIDSNKIKSISGKYSYIDDEYDSSFGIDVSTFQDKIDWEKVKNDGVEFVFIRIGRRGATTGGIYDDDRFLENYEGAINNDIKVGVYFFSQAINEKEAIEEAQYVIDKLKDKKIQLPIAYDCEDVVLENEVARVIKLTKQEMTNNALAFLKEIEDAGYKGMLYSYPYWSETYYDMEQFKDYPLWFAQYDVDTPDEDYPLNIWQYSDKGTVNGINHPVDLNIMFIKKED